MLDWVPRQACPCESSHLHLLQGSRVGANVPRRRDGRTLVDPYGLLRFLNVMEPSDLILNTDDAFSLVPSVELLYKAEVGPATTNVPGQPAIPEQLGTHWMRGRALRIISRALARGMRRVAIRYAATTLALLPGRCQRRRRHARRGARRSTRCSVDALIPAWQCTSTLPSPSSPSLMNAMHWGKNERMSNFGESRIGSCSVLKPCAAVSRLAHMRGHETSSAHFRQSEGSHTHRAQDVRDAHALQVFRLERCFPWSEKQAWNDFVHRARGQSSVWVEEGSYDPF